MARFDFILRKMLRFNKPVACICVSVLAHVSTLYAFGMFGRFDFGVPVQLTSAISVELKDAPRLQEAQKENGVGEDEASTYDEHLNPEHLSIAAAAQEAIARSEPTNAPLPDKGPSLAATDAAQPLIAPASVQAKPRPQPPKFELLHPLRLSSEFMGAESETLTYRICLLGVPVGSAILQAHRDKSEVWLSLKVTSDAVMSNIYPVDDLIETRHINGNFIVTRI